MIEKRVSNVGIYCTVHQMYAESNVTSCICHKLGICTLVTDTGSHVTLRIHLMYSIAYVRYSLDLSIIYSWY